jgi:hypothetical protein
MVAEWAAVGDEVEVMIEAEFTRPAAGAKPGK